MCETSSQVLSTTFFFLSKQSLSQHCTKHSKAQAQLEDYFHLLLFQSHREDYYLDKNTTNYLRKIAEKSYSKLRQSTAWTLWV